MKRVFYLAAGLFIALTLVVAVALNAGAHHGDSPDWDGPNGVTLIVGTAGNDDLRGGNGPDIIRAKGGDDRLGGEHGPDVLYGGPGDDLFLGGRGPDTFVCGRGFDIVKNKWDTGNDTIDVSCEVVRVP
jgi:Ca2+-binding RTX toxin-like protein